MNNIFKITICHLICSVFLCSCSIHREIPINSNPEGALVYYYNGRSYSNNKWTYLGQTPFLGNFIFSTPNDLIELKVEKYWYLPKKIIVRSNTEEIQVSLTEEEKYFSKDMKTILDQKGKPNYRDSWKSSAGRVNVWYYYDTEEKIIFLNNDFYNETKMTDKEKVKKEFMWQLPDDVEEYIRGSYKIERWWYRGGIITKKWGAGTFCFTFKNDILEDIYRSN